MSSPFDKTPEGGERHEGTEHTRPLGPPPGYGQPSGYPPPGPGQQGGYPPPPYGYGPPGYPPGHGFAPDHPKAGTSLVLGILGVVLCQVVAPFAWVTGKRTLTEIDASGGRWGGRGQAQAGYVLGVVGTVLLALSVAALLLWALFAIIGLAGVASGL